MATAAAGRARQGCVAGSRAFRAPFQRDRLAVGGRGRGEDKPKALEPSSCARNARSGHGRTRPEIEEVRDKVHCAVVLERTPPPWKLDRKESTRLSLKYRRGKGEILIVSHAGRGWWDPTSDAKGDVFGLVQRLEPTFSFGHVRKRLREFAGLSPRFTPVERAGGRESPDRPVAERWAERKAVWPNSPTWRYLSRKRGLPAAIIEAASAAGVLREGPAGSAWFAHLDGHGVVAHVDVRGPTYKGSLTGGAKSLFRLPPNRPFLPRLVLAEAAIDALSVAAIESLRRDTLYAATGGGMGPGTIAALEALLASMERLPGALLCSAADANGPGDRFADRHRSLAEKFGISFARLCPPIGGGDWNDVLRAIRNDGSTPMTLLDTTAVPAGGVARAFVLLKSGRRLDLLNPDPQAWTDGNPVEGLSRTMRWGGASRWAQPLSVAQHSLTVLAIREAEGPLTAREGLRELLHDAAEFMLGWDCITPLKAQLGAPFRQLEARLRRRISSFKVWFSRLTAERPAISFSLSCRSRSTSPINPQTSPMSSARSASQANQSSRGSSKA